MEFKKKMNEGRVYTARDDEPYQAAKAPFVNREFELAFRYELREKSRIYAQYAARMAKAIGLSGLGIGAVALANLHPQLKRGPMKKICNAAGVGAAGIGLIGAKERVEDAHEHLIGDLENLDEFLEEHAEGGYLTYYTMSGVRPVYMRGARHARGIFDRLEYLKDAGCALKEGDMNVAKKYLNLATHLPEYSWGEMHGVARVYTKDGMPTNTVDCTLFPEWPKLIMAVRDDPESWYARHVGDEPNLYWRGANMTAAYRNLEQVCTTENIFQRPMSPSGLISAALGEISRHDFSGDREAEIDSFTTVKQVAKTLIYELMSDEDGVTTEDSHCVKQKEAELIFAAIYRRETARVSAYQERSTKYLRKIMNYVQEKNFEDAAEYTEELMVMCKLSIKDESMALTFGGKMTHAEPAHAFGFPLYPENVSETFMPGKSPYARLGEGLWGDGKFPLHPTSPKMAVGAELMEWSGATTGVERGKKSQDGSEYQIPDDVMVRWSDYAPIIRMYSDLWSVSEEDGLLLYRNIPIERLMRNYSYPIPFDETPCPPTFALTILWTLVNAANDATAIPRARAIFNFIIDRHITMSIESRVVPMAECMTADRFIEIADRFCVEHARKSKDLFVEKYKMLFEGENTKSKEELEEIWSECCKDFHAGKLSRYHYTQVGLQLTTILPDSVTAGFEYLHADLDPVHENNLDRIDAELAGNELAVLERFHKVTCMSRSLKLHPGYYEVRAVESADHLFYCGFDLSQAWLELPMDAYMIPGFTPETNFAPNIFSLVCYYVFNGDVAQAYRIFHSVPNLMPEDERKECEAILTLAATLNTRYRERANDVISSIRTHNAHGQWAEANQIFTEQVCNRMEINVLERRGLECDLLEPAAAAFAAMPYGGVFSHLSPSMQSMLKPGPLARASSVNNDEEMRKWHKLKGPYQKHFWMYSKIKMEDGRSHLGYCGVDMTALVEELARDGHIQAPAHVKSLVTNLYELVKIMTNGGRIIAARATYAKLEAQHRDQLPVEEMAEIRELLFNATEQPSFVEKSQIMVQMFDKQIHDGMTPEEVSALHHEYLEDGLNFALTPKDERHIRLVLNSALPEFGLENE